MRATAQRQTIKATDTSIHRVGRTVKITSYNMRQGGSREHWARIQAETHPDILLVQETTDPRDFSTDVVEPLGVRNVLWRSAAQNRWGSAILYGGGEVSEIPVPGFEGWVTGGEVDLAGEPTLVFSVHLPPTDGSYLKSGHRLMDELTPMIERRSCILGGDWNFTTCLRDPSDPRSHRPGEVDFLHRMADDFQLLPAWRIAHPKGVLPQTLRWTREPRTPYHCDGVFVPSSLGHHSMSARVLSGPPWLNLSDHNPVAIEWEDLPPASREGE